MFLGHFAVGFASKRFAPRTNMGALIAAPMLLDMLWPVFLLTGWERARIDPGNTRFTPLDLEYFPWSHSLLMSVVWASAFSFFYYVTTRYRPGTVAIWIGVVSHWLLDWITHRPDMQLYPGSRRFGLGLWNHVGATLAVELTMFVVGVWLYVGVTRARDRVGRYGFLAYIVLLLVLYVGDRFSTPPTSVRQDIAWPGIVAEFVLIPWAWWFDDHRDLRSEIGEAGI
ncbi:metal-dependent hydrolase [Tunturiibacter gelidoferens]|uniref:Membrane-bound metal-dependent hydrolase YbcI (DUF457 family) n=1 Tax=Tunturiibacter gelidiferens TaxID=3069689 RepID=A0ACC5NYG2_9BACT|nr:metal-dependent hydrolase [Edaphobacter lichenicola]MBB5339632.1 membrane-bound metal-dependent hydrolase YbcI (DUF457 family) [Edaphobacter lichenicola]